MKLDLFKTKLISRLGKDFAWKDESEDNDSADLSSGLYIRCYEKWFDIDVSLNKDNKFIIYASFPDINFSYDVLKLVNNFNLNVSKLKSFVKQGRRNVLFISYSVFNAISEDDAIDCIVDFVNCLEDRRTYENLNPLIVLLKE